VTRFLRGLAKFIALVLVAGGVGVALGMGLSSLSEDNPAAPVADAQTTESSGSSLTPTAAKLPPATATTTAPATVTTAPPTPPDPLAQIRVRVLDARLFTDETPSGRQEQRARVTVRIRAGNGGSERVPLPSPILRVGSVRVPTDASGEQFEPLAAGASHTVTLRFALSGEATPKVVRDRRARILIAGRSVAMRVKVQAPAS